MSSSSEKKFEKMLEFETNLEKLATIRAKQRIFTIVINIKPFSLKKLEVPAIDDDDVYEIVHQISLNENFAIDHKIIATPYVKKYLKIDKETMFSIIVNFHVAGGSIIVDSIPPTNSDTREIQLHDWFDKQSLWLVNFTVNQKSGMLESISFNHDWNEHKELMKMVERRLVNDIINDLRGPHAKLYNKLQ